MNTREKVQNMIDGGYRVVPLLPHKKWPYARKWQDRLFGPDDFRPDAGIGIVTGHGVIGVDVDSYSADVSKAIADEATRRFGKTLERVGQAPKTALFYRAPEGIRKTKVALSASGAAPEGKSEAVEILGLGQQCVADGIHPDTGQPYRWTESEPWDELTDGIDSLPEVTEDQIGDFLAWVERKHGAGHRTEHGAGHRTEHGAEHGMGQRLLETVVDMRADAAQPRDMSDAEVGQLLLDVPAAGLDYDDWVRVGMALAHQYQKSEVGFKLWDDWSKLDPEGYAKLKPNELANKWRSFGGKEKPVTMATVAHMAQEAQAEHKAARSRQGFGFVRVGDLEYRAPEFVVDGLIETQTLGLLFGDPGCGKSFLAVDLALSVASGTSFHGREVKRGPVFFIAGEGHNGLARRFAAWSKDRGVDLANVPMLKSTRAAQFLDGKSAEEVANCVETLAEGHGAPAMIIIDTLARNFGAGDENSTQDMSNFVIAMDNLQERFPDCAILIVHHSGHADKARARGAMALKGALDLEYRVEKSGASLRLVNTKMKDSEPPADLFFAFRPVDLTGGASSAVLEATEGAAREVKLTPTQEVAMKAYGAAAITHGVRSSGDSVGVGLEHWREAFYSAHTGDTQDAKRKAFQRVRTSLDAAGVVTVEDDVYYAKGVGFTAEHLLPRRERHLAAPSGT